MDLHVAWEDEHLLVVDKPAGVVVHPGAGHESGTLVARPARARRGRRRRGPAGDRPPPRPRHLRPARRRALGRGARAAAGARFAGARSSGATSRSSRGRRARARGRIEAPIGRDRVDKTRHSLDTATPRERRDALRGASSCSARARCCDVRLETGPHAPDPRAPGGDRAVRSPATRSTASPATSGSSASSCTRLGSRSTTRSPASASTSSRRCPRISQRRSSARARSQPDRRYTVAASSFPPSRRLRTGGGAGCSETCERFRPRPAGLHRNQP